MPQMSKVILALLLPCCLLILIHQLHIFTSPSSPSVEPSFKCIACHNCIALLFSAFLFGVEPVNTSDNTGISKRQKKRIPQYQKSGTFGLIIDSNHMFEASISFVDQISHFYKPPTFLVISLSNLSFPQAISPHIPVRAEPALRSKAQQSMLALDRCWLRRWQQRRLSPVQNCCWRR